LFGEKLSSAPDNVDFYNDLRIQYQHLHHITRLNPECTVILKEIHLICFPKLLQSMKTRLTILTLGFILITGYSTKAQIGFGVELYGGTQLSHLDINSSVPETLLFISSPLDVHFGGTFLTTFRPNWQIALQGEYLRIPVKENWTGGISVGEFKRDAYAIYSLGLRYTFENDYTAFYLQPSFGLASNRYIVPNIPGSGNIPGEEKLAIGAVARAEVGMKAYFKNKNYFLLGLRHQIGFENLNKGFYLSSNFYRVGSYGSYTGIFAGIGLDFRKR